jgi:hypothetical protein
MNSHFDTASSALTGTFSVLSLLIVSSLDIGIPIGSANAQEVTFNLPRDIMGTQGDEDAEAPDIASSGRNVYIIWHEAPTIDLAANIYEVWFSRSENRGRDFEGRVNVSDSPATSSEDEQIAAYRRNVYVVWSEDGNEVWFRRSADGGITFESTIKLSTVLGARAPQIAASGDDIYVVWEVAMDEIYFAESHDHGANFSDERNISNTAGMSADPEIALSGNRIIVTWRDATLAGAGNEIFYSQGR